MLNKVIIIVFLVVALAACKKREYPPDAGGNAASPIFFEGTVDGAPVNFKTGQEGYYCFSSYTQREDSIYVFKGLLANYDCSTCAQSLQIEINDNSKSSPNANIAVEQALKPGLRELIKGNGKITELKFKARSNKKINSAVFNFSEGMLSNDSVTVAKAQVFGYQTALLQVATVGGCRNTISSTYFVDQSAGVFACSIGIVSIVGKKITLKATTVGAQNNLKYEWKFGDGSTDTQANTSHTYTYGGTYPLQLNITNENNVTVSANYIIAVGSDVSSCTLGMSIEKMGESTQALNAASIQWRAADGTVYRSDNVPQTNAAFFEVTESNTFPENERGEKGRLLSLKFNAVLSNGTRTLQINSSKAQMAFTYK